MLTTAYRPQPFGQEAAISTGGYRPSVDLKAFNELLPPPIEFIEGSSTGALAVPEGKYEPINGPPKFTKAEVRFSSCVNAVYLG